VSGGALVLCSHGTGDPAGQAAVSALVAAVRARVDVPVLETWVDVQEPQVDAVVSRAVAQGLSPITVVPLLLSAGFHVHVDVAAAARVPGVRATPALGPDPRLADLLVQRLGEAGAVAGDAVVLAAAGSSDARAVADVEVVLAHLRARWDGPVRAGYGSKTAPSVPDAVAAARSARPGARVVVAGYLLAPGFFHDRLAGTGADLVTDPLVPVRDGRAVVDDRLVDLVLDRSRTA
jgi:sirohydrochlorin ferrochelatase